MDGVTETVPMTGSVFTVVTLVASESVAPLLSVMVEVQVMLLGLSKTGAQVRVAAVPNTLLPLVHT